MYKPQLFNKEHYKGFVERASEEDDCKRVFTYFHYIYTNYGNHNVNFIEELQSAIDNFKKENKQEKTICSKLQDGFNLFSESLNDKNTSASTTSSTINITLKQKIYLLDKVGFFDLDKLKNLTEIDKSKIISLILGTSKKNTYDTIRERYYIKDDHKLISELDKIFIDLKLQQVI